MPEKMPRLLHQRQRIQNYNEFHEDLSETKRKQQAARCMDCGVPFCQSWKNDFGYGKPAARFTT